MILSIYFLSLILFILGWIYYFKPGLVQRINSFFKTNVFNDVYILIKRKKIAVVFFLAACLLSTSAFIHVREQKKKLNLAAASINKEIIYDALYAYRKELAKNPDDILILTKCADSYELLGEKNKAAAIRRQIMSLGNKNVTAQQEPAER